MISGNLKKRGRERVNVLYVCLHILLRNIVFVTVLIDDEHQIRKVSILTSLLNHHQRY